MITVVEIRYRLIVLFNLIIMCREYYFILKEGPIATLFVLIIDTQLDADIPFGLVYEIEFYILCENYSQIPRPPIDWSSLLCHLHYDNKDTRRNHMSCKRRQIKPLIAGLFKTSGRYVKGISFSLL